MQDRSGMYWFNSLHPLRVSELHFPLYFGANRFRRFARIEKIHSHRQSFLRIIDELAAIITVTVRSYLQIYWVSAKTGFDKRHTDADGPRAFPYRISA